MVEPTTDPATDPAEPSQDPAEPGDNGNETLIRAGGIVAIALVAAFIVWILVDRSNDDSASSTTPTATTATTTSTSGPAAIADPVGPVVVTADGLFTLVSKVGHVVYWAGPIEGQRYEFTETSAGRVYVRYLPKGVKAGGGGGEHLIVATYPFPDAYKALKAVGNGDEVKIPGGGIALVSSGYPQSVHFAFPKVAYQGEVYDPSPAKAFEVATSEISNPFPDGREGAERSRRRRGWVE